MIPLAKRSTMLLLSTSLLLSASPAYAASPSTTVSSPVAAVQPSAVKLSKEAALSIAKQYVQLTEGMQLTNASFRAGDPWRSFPEWSFSWVKKTDDGEGGGPSINVSVHADTGELTMYSYYENSRSNPPTANPLDRSQAEKAARAFLQKHAQARLNDVELYERDMPKPKNPLGTQVFHTFRFVRMVDGIPFPDNGIDLTVRGDGTVTSYQLNWNDKIRFAKPDTVISREEATQTYAKESLAKPVYMIPWDRPRTNQTPDIFLVYTNPFEYLVDAASGKPLGYDFQPRQTETDPIPVSDRPLSPRHQGEPLSQDEAVKIAQSLIDVSGYKLQGVTYHEDQYRGGRGFWDLQYQGADNARSTPYLYISIDAQTGDVLTFSKEKMYPLEEQAQNSGKTKWTTENSREKAMETLRKWSPAVASELYFIGPQDGNRGDGQPDRIFLQFRRLINGIPAATGSANITLDASSGEILHYYVERGQESYPKETPPHRSGEEAVEAWLNETNVELVYMVPFVNQLFLKDGGSDQQTARLVYRAMVTPYEEPYGYNAETGEWISLSSGKTVSLHKPEPADLAGHPAEKELRLMYDYDAISLVDGKLMPDRPITRGEMIKMLVVTFHNGNFNPQWFANRKASFSDVAAESRYFGYVEAAASQGLLDKTSGKLNPEEQITRSELAEMLVRALGYEKLSGYSSLFATDITDIADAADRGPIAIVTTLGIMSAPDKKFRPDDTVSRADAAVAFSRFLEKRRILNDQRVSPYE